MLAVTPDEGVGGAVGKRDEIAGSIWWLFVFLPVTLGLERAGRVPDPWVLFSAALAIIPVAAPSVRSTEHSLSFGRAEIGALFFAQLVGTIVSGAGHSNWYEGVQLVTLYAVIALMFYFIPVAEDVVSDAFGRPPRGRLGNVAPAGDPVVGEAGTRAGAAWLLREAEWHGSRPKAAIES